MLQNILFLVIGLLAGGLVASLYFRSEDKKYRKEIEKKLKFLEDNPSPLNLQKIKEFFLHDN